MITLQTYYLEPFIAANAMTAPLSTHWLREAISKLIRAQRQSLGSAGADVTHFYNHNPETNHPSIRYPLVIYHFIGGRFYMVGINEGAHALSLLAERFSSPFSVDNILFQGFKKENQGGEFNLCTTPDMRTYQLTQWLPLHHKDLKTFSKKDMLSKVTEMNLKLGKHITNELGKYLRIHFDDFVATITDITRVYSEPVVYKGYHYRAFDIRFETNVALPPFITLGNNKSLGFGRVELA